MIGLLKDLDDADEMEIDLENYKNLEKLEAPMRATSTRLNRYGQLPQILNKNAIKAGLLLGNAGKVVKKGAFSEQMINTGRLFIERINKWAGIDDKPEGAEGKFYNKLGKKDTVEFLYVDGRPIREFVSDKYGYKGSANKNEERQILSAYAAMIAARQNHPITLVRPVIINGVADVDIRNVGIDMGNGRGREAKIKGIRYGLTGEEYRKFCEDAYRSQMRAEAGDAYREVKGQSIEALKKMETLRGALRTAGKGKHKDYDDFVRTFNTYFDALEFICLDPDHMDVSKNDLKNLFRLNETAKDCAYSYLRGKKMNLDRHKAIRDIRDMLSDHSRLFSRVIKSGDLDEEGSTMSIKDILDHDSDGFVVVGIEDEVDQYIEAQKENTQDKNEYSRLDPESGLSVRQKQILRMKSKIDSDESSRLLYNKMMTSIHDERMDDDTRMGFAMGFLKAASSALLTDDHYGPLLRKRYKYAGDNNELLLYSTAKDQLTKLYSDRIKENPLLQAALDSWGEQVASEEAEALSYRSNTVGDRISAKEFKENGGSSDHRYVSTAEANEIVAASKGFLCAKKVKGHDNLREIKPSLPEHVTIPRGEAAGEVVEFRKTFKAVFKTAAYMLFDKKGKIKKDVEKYDFADEIHDTKPGRIDHLLRVGTSQREQNNAETFIVEVFMPAMTQMLEEEYRRKKVKNAAGKAEDDAFNYCQNYLKLIRSNVGAFVQSPDISFEIFQIQTNVIRDAKIEDILQDDLIKDLTIEGQKVTEEEVREAYDEIQKQADTAEEDLKNILNMDIDDEEVCEVNSCVDNSLFNNVLMEGFLKQKADTYEYKYSSMASRDPQGLIDYLKADWDNLVMIADLDAEKEKQLHDKLLKIESNLKADGKLNMADSDALKDMVTDYFGKYELHRVPLVGKVGKSSYTVETFGASPDMAIQSPLTTKVKIGKYNSDKPAVEDKHEGVNKYYSHDDAFSHMRSRKKLILCKLKEIFHSRMVQVQNQIN